MSQLGNDYSRMLIKNQLNPQLITFDLPFTRLEAKPEAFRDNLKSLVAFPFLVAKKGEKPYAELDYTG